MRLPFRHTGTEDSTRLCRNALQLSRMFFKRQVNGIQRQIRFKSQVRYSSSCHSRLGAVTSFYRVISNSLMVWSALPTATIAPSGANIKDVTPFPKLEIVCFSA